MNKPISYDNTNLRNKSFIRSKNKQQLLRRMKIIWSASFIIHKTKKKSSILTLSYWSKINCYLYIQRVLWLWKKTLWYILRGQCCPSSRVWQPSAASNGRLAHFLLKFNLLYRMWQPSAASNGRLAHLKFEKKCAKLHYYLEGCHTRPDNSAELFAEGSKGTLRPAFHANTRPRIIF